MSRYMVRVYFRYHWYRFISYWEREKTTMIKDIASNRFNSMLCGSISIMLIWSFYILNDVYYRNMSIVFFILALTFHIYRDYRKGIHIGWNRKVAKEKCKHE